MINTSINYALARLHTLRHVWCVYFNRGSIPVGEDSLGKNCEMFGHTQIGFGGSCIQSSIAYPAIV